MRDHIFSPFVRLALCLVLSCLVDTGARANPRLDSQVSGDVREGIRVFLMDGYLNGGIAQAGAYRDYYAPWLEKYWKRKNVPVSEVIADKKRFLRRWPQRDYRMIDDSLEIYRLFDDPDSYAVRFSYDFEARGRGRVSAGLGLAELLIRFKDGYPIIYRETGRVVRRY